MFWSTDRHVYLSVIQLRFYLSSTLGPHRALCLVLMLGWRHDRNRKSRVLGWETADQLEKRIAGSWNRKSRVLGWETAEEWKKSIVGSWNRKSRGFEGETADQYEKSIVGSRWSKTAEKTRAQSPKSNWGSGGDPWSENTKKKFKYFLLSYFFTISERKMSMRVPW